MDYAAIEIIPHAMGCTRELSTHLANVTDASWLITANDILYFAYPGVLGIALVFAIFSSIVTCRLVTDSHECYIAGFNVASFIMLILTSVIHLPYYTTMQPAAMDRYKAILPYLPPVENWCWYTCTWLLITALAERLGHAVCGNWHASFGRIHGILASFLIIVVCFVCTLPQYWEYTTSSSLVPHDHHNCTVLTVAPHAHLVDSNGRLIREYEVYHWISLAVSIAIPYLVLPIMIPGMCCVKMSAYTSVNTADKFAVSLKDQVVDERSFNRMLAAQVALYLVLSAPRNAVRLMEKSPIDRPILDDRLLMTTLYVFFDLVFFLFFIILFFLYCCVGSKFICTLKRMCCCKSTNDDDYMY